MKPARVITPWIAAGILAAAGFAVYANSLRVPFFFDDPLAILDNPTIRNLTALGDVLMPPNNGSGVTGRPLVNLSLAINHALGGSNPVGYHAGNILLHICAGLALFGLVRRTLMSPVLRDHLGEAALPVAFLTAGLWMLHPLQTESVTCVIQRTELLVGVFYLLTLYSFTRATAERSPLWPALAIAACFAGMASKEVMVSAPLIVLLYDRTFVAGSFAEAWRRRRGIYLGLAASWLLLGFLVAGAGGARGEAAGFSVGVTWWSYALKQCEAIVLYLRLTAWPNPLVVFYGTEVVTHPAEVWPHALLLIALVTATCWAAWRRPKLGFAGLWFFAILAPSSSVVPLVTQTVSEHRMYLPLVAPLVLGVSGLYLALGRRAYAIAALAALSLGLASRARNTDYRSELSIWTDTVAKVPRNARAHINLGAVHAAAGHRAAALASYQTALRLEPNSPDALNNIATIAIETGRPGDAIEPCRAALRLRPKHALAHNNLGTALVQTGQPAAGAEHLRTALSLISDFPEAHCNLASAYLALGDPTKAIAHAERALALRPNFALAHFHLASALIQTNQTDRAIVALQAALRLQPDYAEAHSNLGSLLYRAGNPAGAIPHFEAALRINPTFGDARSNLASALLQTGRTEEAVSHYRSALQLSPNHIPTHSNLALALLRLGRNAEAATEYEAVLRLSPDDARARNELTRLRGK